MSVEFDAVYRDRARDAMLWALVSEFTVDVDGRHVCVLRNGEILDAAISVAALLLANARETSSPTKLRNLGDEVRGKLIRRVRATQEHGMAGMEVVHLAKIQ